MPRLAPVTTARRPVTSNLKDMAISFVLSAGIVRGALQIQPSR
jgi:hypothetical protein